MEVMLPLIACQQSHQYIEHGLQGITVRKSSGVHSVRIDQAPRVEGLA